MEIFKTPEAMQAWALARRAEGKTIGLAPTMGYWHEGHLSLIRVAAKNADVVVASIFVNPAQFAPTEDLANYPRNLERDLSLAEKEGVHAVFTPAPEAMYPAGFQSEVKIREITQSMEGSTRPTHFAGVTTVLTKLFNIVQPSVACFGEKDYQQLAVVRRMVLDLNMPVSIIACPIVREQDGLAMSSRNSYLTAQDRPAALTLSQGITLARELYRKGERDAVVIGQAVSGHILSQPHTTVDYVCLVDRDTLELVDEVDERTRLILAVYIGGKVRLLDNGSLAEA